MNSTCHQTALLARKAAVFLNGLVVTNSEPFPILIFRPVAAASSGAGWQTLGYSPGASYNGGYAGYRDPGTQTYRDPGTQTYRDTGTQTYRDPGTQAYQGYRGSGYSSAAGGYQDLNYGGYGQASGWRNVGERRPYRDQR